MNSRDQRLARLEVWRERQAHEAGMDAIRLCMRQLTLPELRAWVTAERRQVCGERLTDAEQAALARGRSAFSGPALTAAVHRLAGGHNADAVSDAARRLMFAAIKEHAWRQEWETR